MSQIIYPSRIGYDEVDLSWIIGRAVTEVSFLDPCCWRFLFGPQVYFQVECLWRIIKGRRVVLTCGDHCQLFGLPEPIDAVQQAGALLSGVAVTAVQLRQATADIRIDFADDLCLELIPDSSGYESWHVFAPGGVCFVAQGGGQICTWQNNA